MENINSIIINNKYKFIEFKESGANFYFSTAESGLNFNKNTEEGLQNLVDLKSWFNLKNVAFLNQTHSDIVREFQNEICDGDAILTDKKYIAVGVLTADCVPVLIYDKAKGKVGAVHSGWKGTYSGIVSNSINLMIQKYETKIKDLIIYIGPHIMDCCYEVGEDLIQKFKQHSIYNKINISNGRKLSLKNCIIEQLLNLGLDNSQIHSLDLCTFCNKDFKLHSYRKEKEQSGRMFSFVFLK